MRKTSSQPYGNSLHKLWVNNLTLPQVVFATQGLGINTRFVRNLCQPLTQACAQVIYTFNTSVLLVFPLMHRTNNNYYKGE